MAGAGGAHHEQYPPTRALFHALLFLPPSPGAGSDAQAAPALFDGLLSGGGGGAAAAVAGEQEGVGVGVVAGARLLSLGGGAAAADEPTPQPPTTSTTSSLSPSSTQGPLSQQPPTNPIPVVDPVAAAAAGRTPGAACAALLLEEEAASLAVVTVPATAVATAPLAASDLALLPYDPTSAASIERVLELAARLPEALPRLFLELTPPSHTGINKTAAASSPLAESVRALCAARPLHAHAALQAPPSAFACDALAHETVASCFARFGPPASGLGGGRRRGRGARGGGGGLGAGLFGVGSIVESVLASMEDPGVVALAVGVAAVGLLTLVVRGGWGGREGGKKG